MRDFPLVLLSAPAMSQGVSRDRKKWKIVVTSRIFSANANVMKLDLKEIMAEMRIELRKLQ